MKILQVTDTYLPGLGGIEVFVDDLSKHQRLTGHDVQVMCGTPSIHRQDSAIRVNHTFFSPLRAMIQRERPDVVHCHSSVVSPLAWRAARQAAQLGLPVVITMHSLIARHGAGALTLQGVAGTIPASVRWSAVSHVAAKALEPLVRREVHVLPNGFDTAASIPAAAGTGPVPNIVSVMRLVPRKRPRQLIEILSQVRARLGDQAWTATIIGDGPQGAAVARAIQRAGLSDRVTLTGRLSRPEILRRLATADLYLAPAVQESFGIAALEARCSGVPVVAMRSGGVGEFVDDGVHGYLVGDDADMVRRICQLVRDPALVQRLGRASLATAPDFGWPSTVERHLAAYRQAHDAVPSGGSSSLQSTPLIW